MILSVDVVMQCLTACDALVLAMSVVVAVTILYMIMTVSIAVCWLACRLVVVYHSSGPNINFATLYVLPNTTNKLMIAVYANIITTLTPIHED